ncbi:hypothetical protein HanPI659440_Chr06g0248611 [Helianthus annuus]|nr:hypothetical protein HanPI659440_Chr06g0248611 [Helianthus annuus]
MILILQVVIFAFGFGFGFGFGVISGSSSIKVKDENSGNVYEVGAKDISSAHHTCNLLMVFGLLISLAATCLIN